MATKKSAVKKSAPEKTLLIKIAEGAGYLAGELSVKKDQLMEKASGIIASAKETIHNIGTRQPAVAPKKKAAAIQKSDKKKVAVAPKKKAATIKKSVKKKVAVAAKKVTETVSKKSAAPKKAIKKAAKKTTVKK
ncbi:MAG: hypothetical protein ABJB11_22380 [Ferruginibacter sp.]